MIEIDDLKTQISVLYESLSAWGACPVALYQSSGQEASPSSSETQHHKTNTT
jgi:hypothetical protein